MKKVLTLAFILISIGVNAQYSTKPFYQEPEAYVPASVIVGAFALNESIINSDEFQVMSFQEKRKKTATVYFIGIAVSFGLHFGIKALKDHGIIKQRRRRKHKSSIKLKCF